MQLEQFNGTTFNNGERIDLHAGNENLLSMDEVKAVRAAAELQRVAQDAYKRVQIEQINNHNMIGMPKNPLQLARVVSMRQIKNRSEELRKDQELDFWREAA